MGSEGELRGFARKMPRFRTEMYRGFACFAQGSGRKTTGVGRQLGKEPPRLACNACLHGSSSS